MARQQPLPAERRLPHRPFCCRRATCLWLPTRPPPLATAQWFCRAPTKVTLRGNFNQIPGVNGVKHHHQPSLLDPWTRERERERAFIRAVDPWIHPVLFCLTPLLMFEYSCHLISSSLFSVRTRSRSFRYSTTSHSSSVLCYTFGVIISFCFGIIGHQRNEVNQQHDSPFLSASAGNMA